MATITLPVRCDRAATIALLPEFVAAMGREDLEIDASNTTLVGYAMLQLLASAKNSFARLRIVPSEALRDAARLTALEIHLFEEVSQ